MAWANGIIAAPTVPWTTRIASSTGKFGANAHSNETNVNSEVAVRKSLSWPKRPASQPVSGSMMASATAYDVMTQVP